VKHFGVCFCPELKNVLLQYFAQFRGHGTAYSEVAEFTFITVLSLRRFGAFVPTPYRAELPVAARACVLLVG